MTTRGGDASSAPVDGGAPRVGAVSLLALGVNGIVGVGIFFTPNVIAELVPGTAGAYVYIATAALLVPIAVTLATLGRHLPFNGGPSVWAGAAFGERAGLAVGWIAAVSALLSTAAVLAGVGTHLGAAFALGSLETAFACTLLLSAVAALGLRPSAWTWNALTALKLSPLALLVVLMAWAPHAPVVPRETAATASYGRALLVALFPLQGFEIVPVLAGSVRREHGGLSLATVGSLVIAGVLYAALHLACVASLGDVSREPTPLVAAAGALGGRLAARLVEIGTNVSALGIAFGMLVMTPRYLAVLGTERGLGEWLGRVDQRGVPRGALLITVLCVLFLLASLQAIAALLVLSSAAVLVQYIAAQAALVRLSLGRQNGLVPSNAVPAVLGLGAVALLGFNVATEEIVVLAGAWLVGVALFLLRRFIRSRELSTRKSL